MFISFKVNSDSASVLGLWEQSKVVSARLVRGALNVSCTGSKSLSRKAQGIVCALDRSQGKSCVSHSESISFSRMKPCT